MPEETEEFYLVWRENGAIPHVKHEEYESARKEAERLAKEIPDTRFFILLATHSVVFRVPEQRRIIVLKRLDAPIPF